MKSAKYLVESGLDAGAADQPCQAVHEYLLNEVVFTSPQLGRALGFPAGLA